MFVMKLTALLALLVVGCTQGGHAATKSTPTSVSSPTPGAITSPSPSSSPAAFDLPLSAVGFSCRLPISTPDGQGGFISFPATTVSFDPTGKGLQARGGAYYDRAYLRWLPIPRQAVSPDGRHYAYTEPAPDQTKVPKIHVVDLATGTDRGFNTPSANWFIPYVVLDYASEGIYLIQRYESPDYGLWLLNPSTGTLAKVAQLDYVDGSAGNKIFWLGTIDPNDSHNIGTLYAFADQIDRYNLADGSRVPWLYQAGKGIDLMALDTAGHPIVQVINTFVTEDVVTRLLLLLDPKTQRPILTAPLRFVRSLTQPIADSHGVWFGSPQGLYLYSDAKGLQKVSSQPGYPANGCF
jgi:hypothetical protein